MNPIRDALIGGVLPGTIATTALLGAGLAIALRRGPLAPFAADPSRPDTLEPVTPRGLIERIVAFVATLFTGLGVVLSMRLLETYPAEWWPQAVDKRTPALVGIGVVFAAIVAAGPARWWFALPTCVLGAGVISHGIREPLPFTENLWWTVTLDALAVGTAAFLVQSLINRIANTERRPHGRPLVRPLPLVVLALAFLAVPGILFFSGISVSSRQSGVVQAVLMSAAIVLVIVGNSAGRAALRGVGVLVVMAIGVWLLLALTLGIPVLGGWTIAFVLLAAAGTGICALLLPRLRRWWTPALVTLVLVGAPMGGALAAQFAAGDRGSDAGGSPADYGY
ncbi:MAG: hypothetical protein HRU13_06855 [Phycisphaerales bacterium]|nr:hypothetical protein [Phycisphaerales bacterium]